MVPPAHLWPEAAVSGRHTPGLSARVTREVTGIWPKGGQLPGTSGLEEATALQDHSTTQRPAAR